MKELKKLIDVKSIVTMLLMFSLVYIVISGKKLDEETFLLFSNITTMVITYFFTKRKQEGSDKE